MVFSKGGWISQWIPPSPLYLFSSYFLLLIEVLWYGGGNGGNNHACINLCTRSHSCVHYFSRTLPPAAASARSSISSPFVAKGCGGCSNTLGPRCLNSGPKTLICAYQSGTDNPWHSSSANQVQIECRLQPWCLLQVITIYAHTIYTLHVEVRPLERCTLTLVCLGHYQPLTTVFSLSIHTTGNWEFKWPLLCKKCFKSCQCH